MAGDGDSFLVARNPDRRAPSRTSCASRSAASCSRRARPGRARRASTAIPSTTRTGRRRPRSSTRQPSATAPAGARRSTSWLERARNHRAQFVYTRLRGRQAIFWQTAKVVRQARPGVRVPARRAAGLRTLEIEVDTREQYPYRFASRSVERRRSALPAGDYAVRGPDGRLVACVERKTLPDFTTSLVDGTLNFLMADLAALPAAAVVDEGRYSAIFKLEHVEPGWLAELVARSAVRYPSVPVVWRDNRKLAEEWTWRFLAGGAAELGVGAEQPRAAGTEWT